MDYLKTYDLTVRYPFQSKNVLKGVNLSVQKGEKVLILGASGSGKSSLALSLNGIIPRSMEAELTGRVYVDNNPISNLSFSQVCKHIGILFQDPESQFCMLTVEDEIAFGLENLHLSKEEMKKRIKESLEFVGLTAWKKAQLKDLSGGMKQKLAIACLIAMDPEVFILDEPTANLDPVSTDEVFNLFITLSNKLNKTLLFVEHKLDQLLPYIERVIVISNEGEIIADNTPRHIFSKYYEVLKDQGIWIPRICTKAKELEEYGMSWNQFPLTIEEFQKEHEATKLNLTYTQLQEKTGTNNQPNNESPFLKVSNVSFSYPNYTVLKDVSFSVKKGDFVAIIGPNGAGKSTLAKLLIRLNEPQEGSIQIKSKSLAKLNTRELMQQVGFVFQNPEHQFICDTVEQELAYGLKILGWKKEDWDPQVNTLLRQFYLADHKQTNPFSLSQGQKRRLSVATMLSNDQQLLILDEPTFGQDQMNTEALMKLLKELNEKGKTILMITHDMELVLEYASKVLVLNEGKIAYQGKVSTLFEDKELLQAVSIKVPISYKLHSYFKKLEEGIIVC